MGGVAGYEGTRCHVFGDHAAGADNGTLADAHSGEYHDIGCNPDIIANRNRSGLHYSFVATFGIKGMDNRAESRIRADEYIIPNQYLSLVKNRKIEIGNEIFTDMNIKTEITAERRMYHEPCPDPTDYFPDNRFTFGGS